MTNLLLVIKAVISPALPKLVTIIVSCPNFLFILWYRKLSTDAGEDFWPDFCHLHLDFLSQVGLQLVRGLEHLKYVNLAIAAVTGAACLLFLIVSELIFHEYSGLIGNLEIVVQVIHFLFIGMLLHELSCECIFIEFCPCGILIQGV